LLTHWIEPRLEPGRLIFVYDYPVSQAALARLRPGDPPAGERFELYVNGLELANGFHELGDADEQRRRFEMENAARRTQGLPVMPIDEKLLLAIEAGLPDCAGVALGFDRLVMLAAGRRRWRRCWRFRGTAPENGIQTTDLATFPNRCPIFTAAPACNSGSHRTPSRPNSRITVEPMLKRPSSAPLSSRTAPSPFGDSSSVGCFYRGAG